MIPLITVILVLASVVLGFFVLVQSPKGGGLTGNFGTLSTQVMGVKQSSDVMEKGTWTSMGIIATLCIITIMFVSKPASSEKGSPAQGKQKSSAPAKKAAPTTAQPAAPATPAKR